MKPTSDRQEKISTADNALAEHPTINGRKNLKTPPKDARPILMPLSVPLPYPDRQRAKRNRKAKERTKEK